MKLIPLYALAAFCAVSARAAVMDFGAEFGTVSHDNTIFQNNVNNSAGGGPGIFAGTNGTSSPRRGLISFDLSSMPLGSTITGVTLTLTVGQIAGSGGSGGTNTETIGLFAVSRPWGEGTAENNQTTIGGTGQGAAAGSGDATWNAAAFGSTSWTTPGGDHARTASASITLNNAAPGLSFTWGSTSQLVADVQGWVNNSTTNNGWELINADESDATTFDAFYSREATSAAGVTSPSQLPELEVTFIAPEPVSSLLVAVAGLALFSSRALRRRFPSGAGLRSNA